MAEPLRECPGSSVLSWTRWVPAGLSGWRRACLCSGSPNTNRKRAWKNTTGLLAAPLSWRWEKGPTCTEVEEPEAWHGASLSAHCGQGGSERQGPILLRHSTGRVTQLIPVQSGTRRRVELGACRVMKRGEGALPHPDSHVSHMAPGDGKRGQSW